MSAPGWYPNPSGEPGWRYFNGSEWTEHRTAPPPPQKKGINWTTRIVGAVGTFALFTFIHHHHISSDTVSTSENGRTQHVYSSTPAAAKPLIAAPADVTDTPSNISASQRNAIRKAQDYLSMGGFSRKGLIEQLEYEGFGAQDSADAADSLGADWNAQAAKKAKQYLDMSGFSHSSLIEQLEYDGFTPAQAAYGVSAAGI